MAREEAYHQIGIQKKQGGMVMIKFAYYAYLVLASFLYNFVTKETLEDFCFVPRI